jgi:translation initiation factor 6
LAIQLSDIYRNPNVGIFSKANESFLLMPVAYSEPKSERLASLLGVKLIHASVGGTRLLGPLVAANSNGVLLSRFAEEDELIMLKRETGLNVERLDSPYTSVGNLVAVNDFGAVAGDLFAAKEIRQMKEVFGVPVETGTIAGFSQVGAVVAASNAGALAHPRASEDDLKWIQEALHVGCDVSSINGGVPFVSSGIVVNSRAAVVGTSTTGPELFILGKAFKV